MNASHKAYAGLGFRCWLSFSLSVSLFDDSPTRRLHGTRAFGAHSQKGYARRMKMTEFAADRLLSASTSSEPDCG
jgi:hypothetical protein